MLARFKLLSLSCVASGVVMLAALFLGCTSQPPAAAAEDAVASAERSEPQADEALAGDSSTREEQPAPLADEPRSVNEAPAKASEDSPILANEAASSPAESPDQQPKPAEAVTDRREYRTVFYRADSGQPVTMPKVQLSKGHEALCRVQVGDTMPAFELEQLGGSRTALPQLAGKTATVVLFWKSDRRMSHEALADLAPDVIEPFGSRGVAVVGVAVDEPPASAEAALKIAGVKFPNLLDAEGKAFAEVGSERLPRIYLLDPQGKILWFDIEYSLATRRELHQALRAVTAEQPE
jgi:peroxiredoxin